MQCRTGINGQAFLFCCSITPPNQTIWKIRLFTNTETWDASWTSFKFRDRICVASPKFICSLASSCQTLVLIHNWHSKWRFLHWLHWCSQRRYVGFYLLMLLIFIQPFCLYSPWLIQNALFHPTQLPHRSTFSSAGHILRPWTVPPNKLLTHLSTPHYLSAPQVAELSCSSICHNWPIQSSRKLV